MESLNIREIRIGTMNPILKRALLRCPLSPRERAGVRGKELFANPPFASYCPRTTTNPLETFRARSGHNNCSKWNGQCRFESAAIFKMRQGASLQEIVEKGKRHYYDGVTCRNWKLTMLKMYGGDTRPFLDEAWNAVIMDAESRDRLEFTKANPNKKIVRAGTRAPSRGGAMTFLGQLTMLSLNAIACVMLLGACLSRLPFPYYPRLRWICFAAFTFTAIWRMKDGAAFICIPLACLFNPFFPVHLSHNLWSLLNVLSLLLLLVMSASFVANGKK
jgi:hypothetical protein